MLPRTSLLTYKIPRLTDRCDLLAFPHMEHLWAPWRAQYYLHEKPKRCIFCSSSSQCDSLGKQSNDEESYVLFRERTCFCILNAFPYSVGHLMVAPYRHTAELDDLTEDDLRDLMLAARRCKRLLLQVFKPDGFNIGFNLGAAAGAGMADHLHLHIVPRWNGDANFMTVLSDIRVLTEGLKQTYEKLKKEIQE